MLGRGDPKVSGVLPIALDRATKLIGVISHSSKEYVALAQLHSQVPRERFEEVAREFVGRIYQRPPVRSSVKRVLRVKEVYSIEVLEFEGVYVLMKVACQHGTYVRKLIHDIGEVLGVGAHMRELRRVKTGPFREEGSVRMHDLSEAVYLYRELGREDRLKSMILPQEYIVSHLPKVLIFDGAAAAVSYGADLAVPGVSAISEGVKRGELAALLTLKGELVALAEALMSTEEVLASSRGIAFKTVRVVMERGVYPKSWKKKHEQGA
ncbi:MAG: RNA-guided pseudouridylation complex pseudouridine synthase subunit Cbf5 [Sulfolobales archaeon]